MTKARTLADLLDSSGDVKSSALDNQSSDIASVEDDTSPSLGGDLDLNSSDITGTGNIDITGSADFSSSATIGTDVILGSTSQGLIFGNTNGVNIRSGSGKHTIFDNNGSERMRLTSGGNLGLGENNPSKKLVINENDSEAAMIIKSSDTGHAALYFGDQSDEIIGGISYDNTNDLLQLRSSNNNVAVSIDSSERVGVGTVSPQGDLDIRNGTNQKLIIGNSGSYAGGEYGQLLFKESNTELAKVQWNGTGNEFEINNKVSTGTVSFKQNDTQRMQISSSGQVIVTGQGNDTSVRSTSSLMAAPNLVINGTSPPQMENKIVANGTTLNWFVEGFPQRYGNDSNSDFQTVTLTAMHIANNSTTTRDLFNLGFHKGWAWHLCEIEVWGVYYISGYRKYMVRNHSSYSTPFLTQTESYGYMNATPSVTMSNNGRFLNGTRTSYTGSANDTSYYDQKLQLSMPAYSRSFTRVKFLGVADNAFRHGSDITNGRQVRLYQPV